MPYQAFYTVDSHNQKGSGERAPSVKVISPSEASAEKAKNLSSASFEKQSAKAIKCRVEISAEEKKETY